MGEVDEGPEIVVNGATVGHGMDGMAAALVAMTSGRKPTWQCEFCGRFYSERTAKDHAWCIQEYDRQCAERAGAFDV